MYAHFVGGPLSHSGKLQLICDYDVFLLKVNSTVTKCISPNALLFFRQRQIINELELLQRLPVTQEQLLHPNYHPSPLAYAIQAQMPQLAPPPVPPPPPARPEPSFRGMSREDFHLRVRNRLEDVAQAALNRTDGEREYQQKELMIKSRLRYVTFMVSVWCGEIRKQFH